MALLFANNNSLSSITSLPASITGGSINLIQSQTASSSSTISFTSGIDSTYKEYIFKFINIHPASNSANFTFQASTDGGSNYNTTITTTYFEAYHAESDGASGLGYEANKDLAQSTSFQPLFWSTGSGNDESGNGALHLFNPSSTSFVKHIMHTGSHNTSYTYAINTFMAGYFNTTSAINAVQFKYNTDSISTGTIKMYGVS